jgi:hypothetical protein
MASIPVVTVKGRGRHLREGEEATKKKAKHVSRTSESISVFRPSEYPKHTIGALPSMKRAQWRRGRPCEGSGKLTQNPQRNPIAF